MSDWSPVPGPTMSPTSRKQKFEFQKRKIRMKGFFHQLRNFGNGIEDDLREIKLAKQVPARSCPQTIYADSLLEDARDRARAAKEKVTFMVATCCGTSLEALVAASESLLDEQEERMNEVESVLESEGGGYARCKPFFASFESFSHLQGSPLVRALKQASWRQKKMMLNRCLIKRCTLRGTQGSLLSSPIPQPSLRKYFFELQASFLKSIQIRPMKFNRYDDPKTPTLDDFGIASSSHTMSGAFLHNKENTAPASKTATRLDGLFDQTAVSKVSVEISRLGCEASSATQTQSPVS